MCLKPSVSAADNLFPMVWIKRIVRMLEISLCVLFFTIFLAGSTWIIPSTLGGNARHYTRPFEFEFVNWTLNALGIKLGQGSLETPYYFHGSASHKLVEDYLGLMNTISSDENKLNIIYTDPSVKNPLVSSESLRSELSRQYKRQNQIAPMAEAILQEQISTTLAELGLTTGGQPIPPVLFHSTPLPYNLVISPRGKIMEEVSISLSTDLTLDQQVFLENQVDKALDVSSLVVPVGGIGTYPTMIERTTALDWLSDTIAHEWTHNWLTYHPLGLNYDSSPELRTMNETTASIVGGEVGKAMLTRFYPELAPDFANYLKVVRLPTSPPLASFDFRAEMHTTRIHVDELLAAGKITEAEAFMEQRRQFFWNQGCSQCFIRKLNQAYFAFYGAYADIPGGAAGEDPVGPAVRALRTKSRSLATFLKTIGQMSSFRQLQDSLAQ
jgi:hypothetical protein